MVSFEDPNFTFLLLKEANIGLWKIETEEGKPQRLFANEVVYKILGIDGSKLTPEEYYTACFDKIESEDRANLRKAFRPTLTPGVKKKGYPQYEVGFCGFTC